jgi:hypothetical protein
LFDINNIYVYVYMPLSINEIRKKAEILVLHPDWPMTGISVSDRARIEARADQLRRTSGPPPPAPVLVRQNANNIGGALKRTKKRVYGKKNKTKKLKKKSKKPKKPKKKSKTKKRSLLRKLFL